ncbi:hypothetical protein D9M73_293170 [compost metagenome]
MHVPIDYRHFAEPVTGLGRLDGHRDVGQHAEAHGLVRQAVVTRWARQGIGVVGFALEHGIHRRHGEASG